MGEEKEVQVSAQTTIVKLLNYGAIAVLAIGLVHGITTAAGSEFTAGPLKFAAFLWSTLWGVFFGGVLAGLAALVSSRK